MVPLLLCIASCWLSAMTSSDAAAVPLQTSQDQALDSKERLPDSYRCPNVIAQSASNESAGNDEVKINYQIFLMDFSNVPTHMRRVKVFCRTGYFLAITGEKKVVGITNMSSDKLLFELQSMGTSIVRLKNVRTGRYLAINQKGRLTSQSKITPDSFFKEHKEDNNWHSFASHKYFTVRRHNLFLGIRKDGRYKPPKLTLPGHIAAQFLVLEENFNRTDGKYSFFLDTKSGRRSADD